MGIDEKIKGWIANTESKLNPVSDKTLSKVSTIIKELNAFIDSALSLSDKGIEERLNYLVGYFTLTLDFKLDNFNILRARKFEGGRDKKPCFTTVKELSYPPSRFASLGRCNKEKESIFYGCLYWKDTVGATKTALSEVRATKHERINVIKLESTEVIKLRYIGIWDYVARNVKPYFLSDDAWDYYKEIHEEMKKRFNSDLFISVLLCDVFFADIMSRKGSKKLYEVTSILSSMFLEGDFTDGILYTSVENKSFPVVALRTNVIGKKLKYVSAVCYEVEEDYGYAQYKVKNLYNAYSLSNGTIPWVEV